MYTFIFSPCAVSCFLNSSLFELLVFMLALGSVLGDFLSGDCTNLTACCSVVCLFSLCHYKMLNYILCSYSTVLVF